MSIPGRLLKTGPFCSRCGPTDRDPIVSYRCKRCGAPIPAPMKSIFRKYRKEIFFFILFALGVVALLVQIDLK